MLGGNSQGGGKPSIKIKKATYIGEGGMRVEVERGVSFLKGGGCNFTTLLWIR